MRPSPRPVLFAALCAFVLTACGARHVAPPEALDDTPALIVLQLNDVYEINPVGGEGGLARVATLRAQLEREAPVLTVMAGDFLSPSAMGVAKFDGERIAGAQMVGTLNAMGLDVATLGNHEFDLSEAQLTARIAESKFTWVSSNITRADGSPIAAVVPRVVRDVGDVKVGIFSVTLDDNNPAWVKFDTDYQAVARREIAALQAEGAQVIIGLTHLSLQDDIELAASVPEIDVIMGGHEHENWQIRRGADRTPICKADANARTVFVHRLMLDEYGVETNPLLVPVNEGFADDPATAAEAKRWTDKAFASLRAAGVDPDATLATAWTDFDGREGSIRNRSTALTQLLAEALLVEDCAASVYNAGSIRIDDVIPQGATLSAYDVMRILPFGGEVVAGDWTGAMLTRVLDAGYANKGIGGWLQTQGISGAPGSWAVDGTPIDADTAYRICTTDFLLTGREQGLDFLTREAEGISALKDGAPVQSLLSARFAEGPTE